MIEIRELELFKQTVTFVIETDNNHVPNILSVRKGIYSNHEHRVAKYHLKDDQKEVNLVYVNGGTKIIEM